MIEIYVSWEMILKWQSWTGGKERIVGKGEADDAYNVYRIGGDGDSEPRFHSPKSSEWSQGGRPSQLDRTPKHQSAVSVINGELLAARTSPWEFREASTTQLSVPVHIQAAIDLGRDPIPLPLVQMR